MPPGVVLNNDDASDESLTEVEDEYGNRRKRQADTTPVVVDLTLDNEEGSSTEVEDEGQGGRGTNHTDYSHPTLHVHSIRRIEENALDLSQGTLLLF